MRLSKMNARSMWAVQIVVSISMLMALAADVRAADDDLRRWGFGFEDGLRLRYRLTQAWGLEIGGSPDDHKSDHWTTDWDPTMPPAQQGLHYKTDEIREESGWVLLGFSRRLFRQDRIRLAFINQYKYAWSDYRDVRKAITTIGVDEHLLVTNRDMDFLDMYVGLRGSFVVNDRFWLEIAMGYVATWVDERQEIVSNHLNGGILDISRQITTDDWLTIESYGDHGTGSITFLFWF
jgi:hypothetical protein